MAAPGQDAQLHFWAWEGSDARHPCPAPCTEPLHGSLPAPAAASRRKTEPCKTTTASQEGAGLMQLHSPPQQVSPRLTASKGRTSVAVPLQETSLEVTLHSSLISQSPFYPWAPPQGLLCSSICKMLSEMVRHCWNSSSKSDPRWTISLRPPEFTPMGVGIKSSAAYLHHIHPISSHKGIMTRLSTHLPPSHTFPGIFSTSSGIFQVTFNQWAKHPFTF